MDVALTKISSKGQIVIPSDMREDLHDGDKLIIIKNDSQWILKKATDLEKNLEEDLEFARRTEDAWQRIQNGEGTTMEFDEFIEEIKTW